MGAAMVSLIQHAHAPRTPTATAWDLCTSAAVVLASTALLTTCLHAWGDRPGRHRPLFLTCIAASVGCLGIGIARPAPLVLVLAVDLLFGVPWAFAVAYRVTHHDAPAP
jgi:Na+/melibiose symporter-like transporter